MVIDDNGRGQPIQHSLIERNADWHMSRVLDHLLRVDDKIGEKVQVIMVDKDLHEIRVLKKYFPKARVLICFFHEQGVKFCTWLLQNVISTIPSVQHPVLENMVNQVAKSNPQSTIVIEATEYHYAMLYRLKPPSWANDALIHAFCTRLCATNPTARVLGIESTVTGHYAKGMNESLKKKAQELVGEADLLMIPVNVGNSHWCGIAVDVKRTRVLYYDSMNQRTYKTVLDRLSWDLAKTLSDDYEVVSINAPIQTDGHNCGFFVMLRLWRMVDNSIALDVTPKGLTILRFHMLQLVLHGRSK